MRLTMHPLLVYAVLGVVSFLTHCAWEAAHIRLYTNYDALKGRLPVFVYATFGDVFYTFFAILSVGLFKNDPVWFIDAGASQYLFLATLGFFIALFVEIKAKALHRWEYMPAMPIIPLINVGLSPIVQMTVLLPLSVYITVCALSLV